MITALQVVMMVTLYFSLVAMILGFILVGTTRGMPWGIPVAGAVAALGLSHTGVSALAAVISVTVAVILVILAPLAIRK